MSKHLADHRSGSQGARVKRYLALERRRPDVWHRPHKMPGATRLIQFLRIARGREV